MSTPTSNHKTVGQPQPVPLRQVDIAYLQMTEAILNKDLEQVKRLISVYKSITDFTQDDYLYSRFGEEGSFSHRRKFPESCPLLLFAPNIFDQIADELLFDSYLYLVSQLIAKTAAGLFNSYLFCFVFWLVEFILQTYLFTRNVSLDLSHSLSFLYLYIYSYS